MFKIGKGEMHMQSTPLSSDAPGSGNDEGVEALGLNGATLMQLWSIGVARISDLTAHNTESLRKKLTESQKGSAGSRDRIEKTVADIHAAMSNRNIALQAPKKAETVEAKRELPTAREVDYEPEVKWIEESKDARYIKHDPLRQFYRDIRRYPLLSHEKHLELGRRVLEEKDMAARDLLVLHNLRLVLWVARTQLWTTKARKMEWSALEYADLVQEGVLGLMIAAERFDHTQGFAFSTYAQWWIRSTIGRAIQDSGFIRIPVHLQDLLYRVRRAMNAIAIQKGRPPTITEVATAIEESPQRIRGALKAGQMQTAFVSIDEPANRGGDVHRFDDEDGIYELIADETVLRADRVLEAREELNDACARLNALTEALYKDETVPERNREVFARFYGLDGSLQKRTLDHVAEGLGITRERVRQIIETCWEKIQRSDIDMDHDSVVEDLKRIRELEKVTHKRVSAA